MPVMTASQLAQVNSFPKLIDLLREHLEWPIGEDYGIEDVTFEYEPHELGLKPEETAKIREIHQLRPLVTGQPWGVFFLSFEEKTISVTVLRRMLKALVVKKRAGAQSADRQAWNKEDLIFAANFGKSGERELAFVHFSDAASTGDLPVMKVLGWNAKDTKLHNRYVASQLQSRLTWPDDPADQNRWRGQWAGAFETGLNEVIRTSKELAIRLAGLAGDIRARANQLLEAEDESGPMRTMLEAFRKNLIQDLDEDGFADMFAQTICYGMLAAKISRPGADLIADNLADMVPRTNPFLKELFANFLKLGGRDKRSGLDFDELGVRDVVDMLNRANMDAVLRDFGDRNPKEDPVIHFYELFLKEYDPEKRMQRGVFYTPRPVVNFIVRGVDEVLQTEFDLPLGLADTTTWAELARRNEAITIPDHVDPDTPFVQILDPATGTGTFLVEVIELIHQRMVEHWQSEGVSKVEVAQCWNAYVPQHLLPRLTAFELMMAPYTIAHMKVGLKLSETGYTFGSDERARIFLTNALEPARDLAMEFDFMTEALAHEAGAANVAKEKTPFTVVIGNPPYSSVSANLQDFAKSIVEPYRYLDGEKIVEKGALQFEKNLNEDYVKFLRFSEQKIGDNLGILSLVTNNGYQDAVTLRGLRKHLIDKFDIISLVDLHGDADKRELCADGSPDKNVFDIKQGVAVLSLTQLGRHDGCKIRRTDLKGSREKKYGWLIKENLADGVDVPVIAPLFKFDQTIVKYPEYLQWESSLKIFPLNTTGFESGRDELLTDFTTEELEKKIREFCSSQYSDMKERYKLDKGWGAVLFNKRDSIESDEKFEERIQQFLFGPFDVRFCFYRKDLLKTNSFSIAQHLNFASPPSPSLIMMRQVSLEGAYNHAGVSEIVPNNRTFYSKKGKVSGFPLWLKHSAGESYRRPNIDRNYALAFGSAVGLNYEDGIPRGDAQASLGKDFVPQKAEQMSLETAVWDGRSEQVRNFGPRDLFDYIYAVLHAPSYRTRYVEFLKSAFPCIPTPGSRDLFKGLVPLGRELVALHLIKFDEASILKDPEIRFAGTGKAQVEKGYPKYKNGKVMINSSRWFEDVPQDTWVYHTGGYQVCERWLKERAAKGGKNPSDGRILTEEDILHYRRTVTALTETRRIMSEIDQVIEANGGWPGAFKVAKVGS